MKTYVCFGDRMDFRGKVHTNGDLIEMEQPDAEALIAADMPIRAVKDQEETNNVTV